MRQYLLKRLLIAIPTLVIISIIIFTILALAPGDPLGEFASNPAITAEVRENIRKSLGLDRPVYIRYFKWFSSFIRGDMGYSFNSRSPVAQLLAQRLSTTFWVVGSAYIIGLLIAFPLGIISAIKRYSLTDQIITTIAFSTDAGYTNNLATPELRNSSSIKISSEFQSQVYSPLPDLDFNPVFDLLPSQK